MRFFVKRDLFKKGKIYQNFNLRPLFLTNDIFIMCQGASIN